MDVVSHILTSEWEKGECLLSCSDHFSTRERDSSTNWLRGWLDHTGCLDASEKKGIFSAAGNRISILQSFSLWHSHYTDWSVHMKITVLQKNVFRITTMSKYLLNLRFLISGSYCWLHVPDRTFSVSDKSWLVISFMISRTSHYSVVSHLKWLFSTTFYMLITHF